MAIVIMTTVIITLVFTMKWQVRLAIPISMYEYTTLARYYQL